MLGPSLLVAPSFVPETELSEYYLPAGKWTSFFDPSRVVDGPIWMKEKVNLDDIALWVREGSALALGPAGIDRPDYSYAKGIELRIYEVKTGSDSEVDIPSGAGIGISGSINIKSDGRVVRAHFDAKALDVLSLKLYKGGQMFEGQSTGGNAGSLEVNIA